MKLFKVTNGYIGNSNVRCLIIAATEERALELAKENYKKENKNYGTDYYRSLEVCELVSDTSEEYIGTIED